MLNRLWNAIPNGQPMSSPKTAQSKPAQDNASSGDESTSSKHSWLSRIPWVGSTLEEKSQQLWANYALWGKARQWLGYLSKGADSKRLLEVHLKQNSVQQAREVAESLSKPFADTLREVDALLGDLNDPGPLIQAVKGSLSNYSTFCAKSFKNRLPAIQHCAATFKALVDAIDRSGQSTDTIKQAVQTALVEILEQRSFQEVRRPQVLLGLQALLYLTATLMRQHPESLLKKSLTFGEFMQKAVTIVDEEMRRNPSWVEPSIKKYAELYLPQLKLFLHAEEDDMQATYTHKSIRYLLKGLLREQAALVVAALMKSLESLLKESVMDPSESRLFRSIIRGFLPAFERSRLDLVPFIGGDDRHVTDLASWISGIGRTILVGAAPAKPIAFLSSKDVEEHIKGLKEKGFSFAQPYVNRLNIGPEHVPVPKRQEILTVLWKQLNCASKSSLSQKSCARILNALQGLPQETLGIVVSTHDDKLSDASVLSSIEKDKERTQENSAKYADLVQREKAILLARDVILASDQLVQKCTDHSSECDFQKNRHDDLEKGFINNLKSYAATSEDKPSS